MHRSEQHGREEGAARLRWVKKNAMGNAIEVPQQEDMRWR